MPENRYGSVPVESPHGSTVMTYDANGNVLTIARTRRGQSTAETKTFTYDANGNILTESDWT